jgi:hypothetical protein
MGNSESSSGGVTTQYSNTPGLAGSSGRPPVVNATSAPTPPPISPPQAANIPPGAPGAFIYIYKYTYIFTSLLILLL